MRRATAGALLFCLTAAASAQDYPVKSLRVVVGSSAAGGGDIMARIVGQKLAEYLGQSIIVDNRGGAAGAIACEIVAKAPPDGYTLLIASVGMLAINPGIYPKLQYAPQRDFRPITLLGATPYVLVVHPAVAAKSVQELVALARATPGMLNFSSGGAGTGNHFSGELFKLSAGVNIQHVAYKGTAPALTDLISGQVQLMFSNIAPALPHARAGRLRALAVTSAQRAAVAADLPTVAESGYPGFETSTWHALLVPARTPQPIAARLHRDAVKSLQQPEVKERLAGQGTDVAGGTPEQLAAYIRSETAKWAQVIKSTGLKAE